MQHKHLYHRNTCEHRLLYRTPRFTPEHQHTDSAEQREHFERRHAELNARKESVLGRIQTIQSRVPNHQEWERYKQQFIHDFTYWNTEYDRIADGHRNVFQQNLEQVLRKYESQVPGEAEKPKAATQEQVQAQPTNGTLEQLGTNAWAINIPAGSTIQFKFGNYLNWLSFASNSVSLGSLSSNGFHVSRDASNPQRIIIHSNTPFDYSVPSITSGSTRQPVQKTKPSTITPNQVESESATNVQPKKIQPGVQSRNITPQILPQPEKQLPLTQDRRSVAQPKKIVPEAQTHNITPEIRPLPKKQLPQTQSQDSQTSVTSKKIVPDAQDRVVPQKVLPQPEKLLPEVELRDTQVKVQPKKIEVQPVDRLEVIRNKFGDSLTLTDIRESAVRLHLEHLALLPDPLITRMKAMGVKIKLSSTDMPNMDKDPKWQQAPRGWTQSSWKGVPGAFDTSANTVYAGQGGHGSSSLVLHEYGHAFGKNFNLNSATEVTAAHKRLYSKLSSYLQQGGPGGTAGQSEFLADSFGDLFMYTKDQFIRKYDEDWYRFLSLSALKS
jgi:hypothetical protein